MDLLADYPFALKITIEGLLAEAPLTSPTHRINTTREGTTVIVTLANCAYLDRDFVLSAGLGAFKGAAVTARALKEHFILERIAEEENIEADEHDYEHEIELIAEQSEQSPRRVRARLEKNNMMDSLRNQIIERKVVDLVLEHAKFQDRPYKPEQLDVEAVEQAAGGDEEEAAIPEAKHAEPGEPPQRTGVERQ